MNLQEDEELGPDLYSEVTLPFFRYPPKYIDSDLAQKELTPRLTTGGEYSQQERHISRDVFLRYLDHVSISLVCSQQVIQQDGSLFVLDPMFDVTTGVVVSQRESNAELYNHLHVYLQRQREFVADNLLRKKQIARDLELLGFISFMVSLLVTLKKQNKVIDVSQLSGSIPKDLLRTDRELPPVLPSEASRWSPFTAKNSYTNVHGGIAFHKFQQNVQKLGEEFDRLHETRLAACSFPQSQLPTCTVNEQTYYVLFLPVENYYPNTPKLPRWLHAMIAELKSQCLRLPAITDSRIQDFLRKPYGPRKAAQMKTVNVSLQASIEKGILPTVVALLKRTTKTRLNKVDESGKGVIHYAALHCRADVLSALLLAGCTVSLPCHTEDQQPTKTQAIHLAAQSGGLEAVCCLLAHGADPAARDDKGWAPIHLAAFHNFQSVVFHFATVDASCIEMETGDKEKATPLLLAAQNGGFDTVKCLIRLGANLKATDSSNKNIAHIAALQYHINILKYLVQLNHPELQVCQVVLTMLTADPSSGYPEAAARCMDTLTHDKWQPGHIVLLLKYNVIDSLVQLLKREEHQLQYTSVQVLSNLSNIDTIKSELVRVDAIPPLVKLLGSSNDRIQACACVVLSDLGITADNQHCIAKAGAIPHLVKLLKSENDDVQLYSCACLGILAYDNTENQNAISEASGLPSLIALLKSQLSCMQACAASTLQAVLEDNRKNQLSAFAESIIDPLVRLLHSKQVCVHSNAARAIEALANNCEDCQRELLTNCTCICLLKRLLRMRDPAVKVCGGCALWAIAGSLISNQRLIATYIGLELLVDMLSVQKEKLDFVCSEALGALSSELGDNQDKIASVGGVKPLVDILTTPTSLRVSLSVINALASLTMKPALVPNAKLQKAIAASRGIVVLAAVISSPAAEIIRVEAACALAKIVLNNPENDKYLARHTNFSYLLIFKFFTSPDPMVHLRAGYCLAVMAFNNSAKLEAMKKHGTINISNFTRFLESGDKFFQVHAAFQIVVLAKLLTGIRDVDAAVQGIKLLVQLCGALESEQTKVLSAEFLASLAHSKGGIPNTIVMAGALEPLIQNLNSGNDPVIESSCVALGYLTYNPLASRMIIGTFRDEPELYRIFQDHFSTVVVSKTFLEEWNYTELVGLPALR